MTFSAIAIRIFHNFEYFDFCIHIFNQNAFLGNSSVFSFFFCCQCLPSWLFLRRFTVLMIGTDTLISTVTLFFDTAENMIPDCILIQMKVMRFSISFSSTDNFMSFLIDNHLCFYRVPLLFS